MGCTTCGRPTCSSYPVATASCAPDEKLVDWLRLVHPTTSWTIAVGTGSLYLAAAGVLAGAEAATHWSAAETLARYGVSYSDQRLVRAGSVLTSAGASAGIDLALALLDLSHGPAVAQTVQLILEYDPHPPYDAGSPAKAPAEIGELVRAYYAHSATDVPPADALPRPAPPAPSWRQGAVSGSSAPASRVSPYPTARTPRPHRTPDTNEGRRHVRNTFEGP